MPAIRSPKGNTPNDNDKGKGKAPTPISPITRRPRRNNEAKVDPCEVCGFVVSRKSDVARHAKRHAIGDDEKLPCRWEGCKFSTLQKSNLETHYRRHTQEKTRCKDDPECKFKSCDPASMLRHRKRWHGYIPRSAGRKSEKTSNKHVPVRVIRVGEANFASIASQSLTSPSAEGSTSSSPTPTTAQASGPISRQPPLVLSPLPPLEASGSQPRQQPHLGPYSPTLAHWYSSGENEVSPTPTTYNMTPAGPSSTVLSTTSYSIDGDGPLFVPPINDYMYIDSTRPFPSGLLDGCWMDHSGASEIFRCQGQHPVDVVYGNTMSIEDGLSPLFSEMKEWLCPTHLVFDYCHYSSQSSPFQVPPLDVAAMMPFHVNNQSYQNGYISGSDMSYGYVNMSVEQNDIDVDSVFHHSSASGHGDHYFID